MAASDHRESTYRVGRNQFPNLVECLRTFILIGLDPLIYAGVVGLLLRRRGPSPSSSRPWPRYTAKRQRVRTSWGSHKQLERSGMGSFPDLLIQVPLISREGRQSYQRSSDLLEIANSQLFLAPVVFLR